jgi:DNA-nicking Smr family endonuclease
MAKRRADAVPAVSPDDAALFRAAIGEVRRFAPAAETPSPPRPRPEPRQSDLDEAQALRSSQHGWEPGASITPHDPIEYLKPGLSPRLLRQLKRGHYSVQDEIDLHGLTALAAERVLRQFLHECRRHDRLCVRVVHGKGRQSGDEMPVLKALCDGLLRRRADVLAFASARASEGGAGAVRVLLAGRRAGSAAS